MFDHSAIKGVHDAVAPLEIQIDGFQVHNANFLIVFYWKVSTWLSLVVLSFQNWLVLEQLLKKLWVPENPFYRSHCDRLAPIKSPCLDLHLMSYFILYFCRLKILQQGKCSKHLTKWIKRNFPTYISNSWFSYRVIRDNLLHTPLIAIVKLSLVLVFSFDCCI